MKPKTKTKNILLHAYCAVMSLAFVAILAVAYHEPSFYIDSDTYRELGRLPGPISPVQTQNAVPRDNLLICPPSFDEWEEMKPLAEIPKSADHVHADCKTPEYCCLRISKSADGHYLSEEADRILTDPEWNYRYYIYVSAESYRIERSRNPTPTR